MAKPTARARKVLTLEERVKVIKLPESEKSSRNVATELGIGRSQVQGIFKQKADLLSDFEANENRDMKRPRRATGNEEINELCWKWFNDATSRNIAVSGPLLQEKARKFASDLGVDTFKDSNGWLESFLKRHNIVFKAMSGERGDVDKNVVEDWKQRLPGICEGFKPEDIFNMDETGLVFRDTTRSTYIVKGEDCAGGKRSKERITVALCASMTGEKLEPLVIGKSRKPRCFSNIKPENLPVTYRNNTKAWMTRALMEDWLKTVDKMMRKAGRHILLFLDNAPSHSHVPLKNVTLKFFPANTTSMLQPQDQGIIQAMKRNYRKRQLRHIIARMEKESGTTGTQFLKQISILDAIYWISSAWKELPASTITKCFAHAGFSFSTDSAVTPSADDDDDDDEMDSIPLAVLRLSKDLLGCEFSDVSNIDDELATEDNSETDWTKSTQELLKEDSDVEAESDSESVSEPESVISLPTFEDYLSEMKKFALKTGQCQILSSLMGVSDMVTDMRVSTSVKQKSIKDFFSEK